MINEPRFCNMWRIDIGELPPSLNKFYAGMHWSKRKAIVDEWHIRLLEAFRRADLPQHLPTPIMLSVTQFCKGIVRDSDNGVVSAKLCGDALKEYGYIIDDNPTYIRSVELQCVKGKSNKTVILILPAVLE